MRCITCSRVVKIEANVVSECPVCYCVVAYLIPRDYFFTFHFLSSFSALTLLVVSFDP